MNVQFAVKDGEIYILEVNPRASRTVPFVSKVIGMPLAGIAARIMPASRWQLVRARDASKLEHVAVKEAVFPFARFPGVDTVLGPEMRSTGEVMGIDRDFAMAFAKSQLGAGNVLPRRARVHLGARRRQGGASSGAVRELVDTRLPHPRHARHRGALEAHGIPCEQVNKVLEGRPHIVDLMKNGAGPAGFQHHRGRQGAGRFQGHPPHRLAQPHSLLYNIGWCAGGDSSHQGACGGHPYGGAAAVLCERRILRMLMACRPKGLAKPERLSETASFGAGVESGPI